MYKHTYTVISPYKYSHTHPQIMFYRKNWPMFFLINFLKRILIAYNVYSGVQHND